MEDPGAAKRKEEDLLEVGREDEELFLGRPLGGGPLGGGAGYV